MSDGMVPTVGFDYGDNGVLVIERVCPHCRRFIKSGDLKIEVEFKGWHESYKYNYTGWICKKHGEVSPNDLGWFSQDELQ